MFYKKFLDNSVPLSLKSLLKRRSIRRDNLRSNIHLSELDHPEIPKNASTELCLRFYLPKLLDRHETSPELLEKIRHQSKISIKYHLKTKFLNDYNFVCDGRNCFSCENIFQ